jgi:hypothetical protein
MQHPGLAAPHFSAWFLCPAAFLPELQQERWAETPLLSNAKKRMAGRKDFIRGFLGGTKVFI